MPTNQTIIFIITYGRGRGVPRPYRVVFSDYCNNRKTPGTVKTVPYKPPIKENQTGKNRNFRKYYRRSRKTGAGGRGVKKCVLTIF